MRHDNNRDLSIGTYILLAGIAVGIEAFGFEMTALATAGFLGGALMLSLIVASYSHLRTRRRKARGTSEKIAASACPAQMGGAKASGTL